MFYITNNATGKRLLVKELWPLKRRACPYNLLQGKVFHPDEEIRFSRATDIAKVLELAIINWRAAEKDSTGLTVTRG